MILHVTPGRKHLANSRFNIRDMDQRSCVETKHVVWWLSAAVWIIGMMVGHHSALDPVQHTCLRIYCVWLALVVRDNLFSFLSYAVLEVAINILQVISRMNHSLSCVGFYPKILVKILSWYCISESNRYERTISMYWPYPLYSPKG